MMQYFSVIFTLVNLIIRVLSDKHISRFFLINQESQTSLIERKTNVGAMLMFTLLYGVNSPI